MKVLFINRPKSDYVQNFTYTGLCKSIGAQNIIELPWNNRYHFNFRPYPKNIGMGAGNLWASITNRNEKYDLVLIASAHPETLKTYDEVFDSIPKDVPVVFIDAGDWPEIAGDLDRLGGKEIYNRLVKKRPFDLILKREYLKSENHPENVVPFPMSFDMNVLPKLPKEEKYDVGFWAVESHPIRSQVFKLLKGKFDCDENGTHGSQIMSKYKRKGAFYLQELSRCKVSLNFRGAGWDTLRYWEVFGLGGFMISQEPQIHIPEPFLDQEHLIHCKDDLSDLVDLCEYYLERPELRKEIALKGHEHLKKHHTDLARANQLLKEVKNRRLI